jgi:hypothetical protein
MLFLGGKSLWIRYLWENFRLLFSELEAFLSVLDHAEAQARAYKKGQACERLAEGTPVCGVR